MVCPYATTQVSHANAGFNRDRSGTLIAHGRADVSVTWPFAPGGRAREQENDLPAFDGDKKKRADPCGIGPRCAGAFLLQAFSSASTCFSASSQFFRGSPPCPRLSAM